jgi:ATP-binding protein involved in chromosome partitioning
MPTSDALLQALQTVFDPFTGKDLVSSKCISSAQLQGNVAQIDVVVGYPAKSIHSELTEKITKAAQTVAGIGQVKVNIRSQVVAHAVKMGVDLLPQVKNIIGVASGKGGVGKSTTAVNLALALASEGARVGLLDADIYGPSLPHLMGLKDRPESADGKTMEPLEKHGVQVMSIGFLVNPDDAMIWRGPMATQALDQLLRQTNWKNLDYLIVDMPPGTGDIHLTLSQRVPLTAAVIVTTPQDVALLDAQKGVRMFEKVGVPMLGLVENMAMHVCSKCGHIEPIFGADGGKKMAERFDLAYLGALPLNLQIRIQSDAGEPIVASEPNGEIAAIYRQLAHQVGAKLALLDKDQTSKFGKIAVKPV